MNTQCPRQQQEENKVEREWQFQIFLPKFKQHEYILTAQISQNEKYLGIGGWSQIRLYYLFNNKLFKIITFDDTVREIKFTNDSKFLLSGTSHGELYCFDIAKNFKTIYKHKVHEDLISQIVAIDNYQILTCSWDKSIVITDIKQNQKQLEIKNAHEDHITGLDYDKSNDYVISCSLDGFIKFFNGKTGNVIIKQQVFHDKLNKFYGYHDLSKIQYICNHDHHDQLISSCGSMIDIWQIDYKNLQLIKIRCFDYNISLNCSYVNNSRLVVIFTDYLGIFDYDHNLIEKINYNQWDNNIYQKSNRQLSSMNYIMIPGYDKLLVLKRK